MTPARAGLRVRARPCAADHAGQACERNSKREEHSQPDSQSLCADRAPEQNSKMSRDSVILFDQL